MADELTITEQAQIKNQMDGLTAEVKTLDDDGLKALALRAGVEAKDLKRADLEKAILEKAQIEAVAGVMAIRRMEEEEAAMVSTAEDKRPEWARAIRRLHAVFASDVPQEARSGSFEPDKDHPRFGGEHPVPDGKYRPAGADHVYEFKKKRLVSVTAATPANNWGGKDVKAVE